MASSAKRKGDKAELEVQSLLRELGFPEARRKLGAGRQDDMGDIEGVPGQVIQVASYADLARAVREKLLDVESQRLRAGEEFGVVFARRPGGRYVVCMSPTTWARYVNAVGKGACGSESGFVERDGETGDVGAGPGAPGAGSKAVV